MSVDLYHPASFARQAQEFALWCELHETEQAPQLSQGHGLWLDEEGLALLSPVAPRPFRLTSQMFSNRQRGKSLLAQSCGLARGRGAPLEVLDAFAGFGLDGLSLAHLGCQVTAVEREPSIWLLLRQFIQDLGLPVTPLCADVRSILQDAKRQWDVIYLDPMFAPRTKRALPNLGLQHLQYVSGDLDVDVEACLRDSMQAARGRVVLKRRRKDKILGAPTYQLKGQAVRFDIYVC